MLSSQFYKVLQKIKNYLKAKADIRKQSITKIDQK